VRIFSNFAPSFTVNDPYFDQFPNGFAVNPMQIFRIGAAETPSNRAGNAKKGSLRLADCPFCRALIFER
jgi:hypothetical protein